MRDESEEMLTPARVFLMIAPMQVEIGEDDACNPTGDFIERGENF